MLDFVLEIDQLPKQGDDIYAKSHNSSIGGCAYNVADILKHFDVPYTLLAPVGNGHYGNIIAEKMVWSGHRSPLIATRGDNGYSLCLIDNTGERTFISLAGVECNFSLDWFDVIDIEEYDSIYFSGYEVESSDAIIQFCEQHPSLKFYYAPGPRIMKIPHHERIMALNPVLHLNEQEALDFTGASNYTVAAELLFQQTHNTVIITLGDMGAYYKIAGTHELIETFPADVVDTIGAGDSHIGAYISYQQLCHNIHDSIVVSNRISSVVVEQKGSCMSKEVFDSIRL